ncbi:MAG TPA: prefoldin subunit alpha [Candidatus Nanoarchaeia archaeon]|nr:prefoldin subunit alpha [Candidatus Nanoarchaeia archaeon]
MSEQHIHTADCKHDAGELQVLQAQASFLGEQLDAIDSSLMEIEYLKSSLNDLQLVKPGTDIFAPFSNGIFVKAKIEKQDMVLMNVGKNVIVEKTIPDAQQSLHDREKEITTIREDLISQLKKLEEKLISIGDQ